MDIIFLSIHSLLDIWDASNLELLKWKLNAAIFKAPYLKYCLTQSLQPYYR